MPLNPWIKYRKTLFLYFGVGGICAFINWCSFYILNYNLVIDYVVAAAAAFIISSTVNYFLSKKIFISKKEHKNRELIYVYFVSFLAFCVDLLTMMFFIEIMQMVPILSKVLGTGVGFFINYGMRQFFIFSKEVKY